MSSQEAKGLDTINEKKIILLTQDDKKININENLINASFLLKTAYENDKDSNKKEIKIRFTSEIINYVISYVDKYKGIFPKYDKPLNGDFKECVKEWDFDFMKKDIKIIYDIINISNFLDIEPLLNLSCMKIASIIRVKSLNDLSKITF